MIRRVLRTVWNIVWDDDVCECDVPLVIDKDDSACLYCGREL